MAIKRTSRKEIKRVKTIREQAGINLDTKKTRRVRNAVEKAGKPIRFFTKIANKEYFLPIKTPNNKFGRFLSKRRYVLPKYFKDAWAELRQVEWPSRKETTKLTTAVFIFAVIFGILIWVVDLGLDNIFRKVLIK